MNKKNLDKLISDALAIEAEHVKDANALGFMAHALVQATLPYKKILGTEFTRTNGNFRLTVLAPSKVGLPYGSIPRLLVAWITTETVRTKQRELILGHTLAEFMQQLDLSREGKVIARLKDQMIRLFSCSISCSYSDKGRDAGIGLHITEQYDLWWNPKSPDQTALWKSTITLGERFFKEVISTPVPIDIRALKALKRSPMALDIYVWLTYRMSYLKKTTEISWNTLQAQFGADYTRTRDFKRYFLYQLKAVLTVYTNARVDIGKIGLVLKPSSSHILSCL